MLSEFGKFLRVLRISCDETAKDMAQRLGVSASYLSAIEHSKRSIPTDWEEKIGNGYELDEDRKRYLSKVIDRSSAALKVSLSGLSEFRKEIIRIVAKDDLSDEILYRALELLRSELSASDA